MTAPDAPQAAAPEAAAPEAEPKRGRGRIAGDPRNKGRPPILTAPCWWGCGFELSHSNLKEHWMTCPNRPKLKLKEEEK